MKNLISLMLVLVLALTCVSLVGCGGGEKEEAATTSKPEEKPTPAATSTPTHPPAAEAGWKTCRVGETGSISIPEDWGGEVEAQVWWPGTADLRLGLPDVSVHCGGTPFMPGESFEECHSGFALFLSRCCMRTVCPGSKRYLSSIFNGTPHLSTGDDYICTATFPRNSCDICTLNCVLAILGTRLI
ncbi:MAG: hypothetical protein KAU38_02475 [Desulfobacterales bacterium]|nr:hypothetical protein [Desulfobacterales bacterium]